MSRILCTAWPMRGHCVQLFALAEELAERGHQVALAIPAPGDRWAAKLGLSALPWEPSSSERAGDFARELASVFARASRARRAWRTEVTFTRYVYRSYTRIFDGIAPVMADWRPDLVIADHAMLPPIELGHAAGIPAIRVSCFLGGMVPTSASLPHWTSSLPRHMTRTERVHNRALGLLDRPLGLLGYQLEWQRLERGTRTASLASLLARTPLLVGSYFGVEIPRALPPGIQLVGPIRRARHPRMATALRDWLEHTRQRDVAYVSFGTLAALERAQIMALIHGLVRAGLRVLWALPPDQAEALPHVPECVRIEPYVAQDDVLAHPSVALFVTHGGRNSLHESLWHARPMLCMPLFGDQYYNAARLVDARVAIRLDKHRVHAHQVSAAARELLTRAEYAAAARRLGEVLRSARGRERASDMIECALRSGTDHLF